MDKFKVEYLVILKDQGAFCNSVKSFNNLLRANDDIEIKGSKLKYKSLEVKYENKTGTVADKGQRFFNLKFTLSDPERLERYFDFLKTIREIVYKSGGKLNTIWDDVSLFYSIQSYPHINRIENLLRKLITKFMLTTVGIEWEQETLPDDIKSIISNKKRPKNGYVNILHETDFIHLADFLFKPYHSLEISEFYKQLKLVDNIDELKLNDLKQYIPKSNWERYFAKVVDCEDGFLNKKWNRLYELRCLVAHNNFITKAEADEISKITTELEKTFVTASENLDKIRIDKEDKDLLLESVVSNINVLYGEFLRAWKLFEHELIRYAGTTELDEINQTRDVSFNRILNLLAKYERFDEDLYLEIKHLIYLRNALVHDPEIYFTEIELKSFIESLNNLIFLFRNKRLKNSDSIKYGKDKNFVSRRNRKNI